MGGVLVTQPLLEGEYFALCEGDDYWCDSHKLQEQVDFMKNHEDYVACVHNTLRYNCRDNKSTLMYKKGRSRDITLEDKDLSAFDESGDIP